MSVTAHLTGALVTQIASGAVPSGEVSVHLGDCATCRSLVARELDVDLAQAFSGVLAEINAPRSRLGERVLVAAGVPAWLVRSTAQTRSLRLSWLLCSAIVSGLAVAASALPRTGAGFLLPPLLVVAPCLVAIAVGFSYGPSVDPLYEIVLATPASRGAALLARMSAAMAVNSALIAIAAASGGVGQAAFTWFPSMAAVSLVAAVVAARTRPLIGVATGCALWLAEVLSATELTRSPVATLWGPLSQIAYLCVAATLLGVLVNSTRRERGFALARTSASRNGPFPWM